MEESILTSIKKLLGIEESYTHYDSDIIMNINSIFMALRQLGIGPKEGFSIKGPETTWSDYIPDETLIKIESVKTYIYQRVKLIFDPPQSSAHIQVLNESIKEFEWRLNLSYETDYEI